MYYFLVLDQGTLYRRSCRKNFKKFSFDWKLEGLLHFLIVKSDWRKTNTPPSPTISPNASNKSFEIVILFDVVERSGNYVFDIHNALEKDIIGGYAFILGDLNP